MRFKSISPVDKRWEPPTHHPQLCEIRWGSEHTSLLYHSNAYTLNRQILSTVSAVQHSGEKSLPKKRLVNDQPSPHILYPTPLLDSTGDTSRCTIAEEWATHRGRICIIPPPSPFHSRAVCKNKWCPQHIQAPHPSITPLVSVSLLEPFWAAQSAETDAFSISLKSIQFVVTHEGVSSELNYCTLGDAGFLTRPFNSVFKTLFWYSF